MLCTTSLPVLAGATDPDDEDDPPVDFGPDPYSALDPNDIPNGLLLDRAVRGLPPGFHDGRPSARTTDISEWCLIYSGLAREAFGPLPQDEDGEEVLCAPAINAVEARRAGLNTIGLLRFDYARISPTAISDGRLIETDGVLERVYGTDSPYESGELFAASILGADLVTQQGVARFDLDASPHIGNVATAPESLEIDFDDGLGFRHVGIGGQVDVEYRQSGPKFIRIRAHYANGVFESQLLTQVAEFDAPEPTDEYPVDSDDSSYSGYVWEYWSDDGVFDRPVIIMDGFDPFNAAGNSTWEQFYDDLNEENLIEDLRRRGYDFVVVDFNRGGGFIQKNAGVLTNVIRGVRDKIEDVPTRQDIAVVGPSMGGLVSRWALAEMEKNGEEHDVRVYISFDAPQRGANIPLGAQNFAIFFNWLPANTAKAVIALSTIAARQMLVEQLGGEKDMEGFYEKLNELGYPDTRLVAIANGSGNGVGQGYNPGDRLIDYEVNDFVFNKVGFGTMCFNPLEIVIVSAEVGALSPVRDRERRVFDGHVLCITGVVPKIKRAWHVNNGDRFLPWDSAPGSKRYTMVDTFSFPDNDTFGQPEIHHAHHAFIPTVSALDIPTSQLSLNLHDLGDDVYELTPFDQVYFPLDANEDHVEITRQNASWLITEIAGALPICIPPDSGDWTVEESCRIDVNTNFDEDMYILGGVDVIVESGVELDLDFRNHKLDIAAGGKIILEEGAQLR